MEQMFQRHSERPTRKIPYMTKAIPAGLDCQTPLMQKLQLRRYLLINTHDSERQESRKIAFDRSSQLVLEE